MSQDKKATWDNLNRLLRDPETKTLNIQGNKYAIMSDIHLGDGKGADDFHKNEEALKRALEHYKKNGYKLILIGDIEEFWQFDLDKIKRRYDDKIYKNIRALGDANVFRVWGNHDSEWRAYDDPATRRQEKLMGAPEALKMKDKDGKDRILLLHGHQGSTESDKNSWLSRTLVRLLRGPEIFARRLGLYGNPSATKSRVAKDYERIIYSWAKQNKVIIICGHSHRAIFASKSFTGELDARIKECWRVILSGSTPLIVRIRKLFELFQILLNRLDEKVKKREIEPIDPGGILLPCYFNTGCALYTEGITAIEIADDQIKLVKWHRKVKDGKKRKEFDQGKLSDFIAKVI